MNVGSVTLRKLEIVFRRSNLLRRIRQYAKRKRGFRRDFHSVFQVQFRTRVMTACFLRFYPRIIFLFRRGTVRTVIACSMLVYIAFIRSVTRIFDISVLLIRLSGDKNEQD